MRIHLDYIPQNLLQTKMHFRKDINKKLNYLHSLDFESWKGFRPTYIILINNKHKYL